MSPERSLFLTMYIFQNKTHSNFSLGKTRSHSHKILEQTFVSCQQRGKQSLAFALSYVVLMWLHVTNAANCQVCWCTQCCTCIPDSGSELYPFASGPSSTCCSWDVPLGLLRNRACPKLISNPLRSSDDVTLSSCREIHSLQRECVQALQMS